MVSLDEEVCKLAHVMLWRRALRNRDTISAKPAVYAVITSRAFGRLVGQSCVLYVGQSGHFGGSSDRARLYMYRYPGPSSMERRIKNICNELVARRNKVELRWRTVDSSEEAKNAEARLLYLALTNHFELPPLNSAIPRSKPL